MSRAALAFVVALALAAPARAEDCVEMHNLEAGQKAPCKGVLWLSSETRQGLTCIADMPAVVAKRDALAVELDGEKAACAADRAALTARLTAAAPVSEPPSRGAWFGAGAGAVVIVEIVAIVAYVYFAP